MWSRILSCNPLRSIWSDPVILMSKFVKIKALLSLVKRIGVSFRFYVAKQFLGKFHGKNSGSGVIDDPWLNGSPWTNWEEMRWSRYWSRPPNNPLHCMFYFKITPDETVSVMFANPRRTSFRVYCTSVSRSTIMNISNKAAIVALHHDPLRKLQKKNLQVTKTESSTFPVRKITGERCFHGNHDE